MALSRLWNDDILHDILSHLAPSGFPASQADRPGLIALAVCTRVNKLFYGSAVDVLWREVDSLAVVLSVLTPPLLRTESTHQRTFVRILFLTVWSHFTFPILVNVIRFMSRTMVWVWHSQNRRQATVLKRI